ncbi:MAG: hypothetical protein A3F72_15315 [Bacteroidetes bacterium RIFCSPLOWO2_12_FULL_35_15]|nr:MAG: hypothetical protein A3F72_15315 [Bacteroidetes bacterium RIFCSPLOWO2_12_FULL_35_15]
MDKPETPVKAYTQFQLIQLYGVSRSCFVSWIKPFEGEIGELKGKCYTPKQVKIIFSKIDPPQ